MIFNQEKNFKSFFTEYFNQKDYGFIFKGDLSIIPYLTAIDNIFLIKSFKKVLKEKPQLVEWISKKEFLQSKALYLTAVEKILTQYYRLIIENKHYIITDNLSDNISTENQREIIEEFLYLNKIYRIKQTIIID